MKFLLDANMPRSSAEVLRKLGHEAEDVRDVLKLGAEDRSVAQYAKANHTILVTRDFDFADIRNYPPEKYPGIIVLQLPDDAIVTQINEVFGKFISQPEMLGRLTGHLAIVENWRVRFRPA